MKKYDSYKDTGIEWIGEIPTNWDVKKIKFISKICNGQDQKAVLDEDGIYPIYGSGGIFGKANSYLFDKPSVLLGRKGTIDKPQYVEVPFWTVDTSYYTKIHKGFSVRLFYYLCTTINFELYKYGSAIPSMTQGHLNEIKFAIPKSFDEQVSLANYLDHKTTKIDNLIAKKESLIQLLEEERVSVISQAVTKGLDPNVPMKDSGIEWLGEIPEHWKVKKIKFIAILKSGENITSESIKEVGDYPVYGGNGLRGFYSEFTNDGDYILIGRQGALCGNIKYARNRFWASEHAIVCYLEPDNNWLWFGKLLESMNLNQYNQSAAQPGLAVGVIKNLSIPFPSIEFQNEIVEFIIDYEKKTDEIIEKTKNEIRFLKEYKTTLISEVVTGKVDIRNEKLN